MATNPPHLQTRKLTYHLLQKRPGKTLYVVIQKIENQTFSLNEMIRSPPACLRRKFFFFCFLFDGVWDQINKWTRTLITCLNQLMKSVWLVGWSNTFETVKPRLCSLTDDKPMAHDLFLWLPVLSVPWHYNELSSPAKINTDLEISHLLE